MCARLFIKQLLFPGLDVGLRKRMRLARNLRRGNVATLDAGCGNGAFSFAAANLGNRVLGIDSDAEKLARCAEFRHYCGIDPDRCEFEPRSIFELPAIGRKFDQIVCFETLEHIVDDVGAIRALAGALASGGSLHLCTPYRLRKPYYGEIIHDLEDGNHVRLGYTLEDFTALVGGEGLVIARHETLVGYFSMLAINSLNRADHTILKNVRGAALDAAHAVLLLFLYPLTFLDALVPSKFLNLYVEARRP